MPTEQELLEGFNLGDWEILPGKGVFRRGDQEERPEPKVFAVLIALAKRDKVLVTKQDLIDEVWDGRPIPDEPIARCLSRLRHHLDDRQKPHQLIETLQKRGYRLKKSVELHKPAESPASIATTPEQAPSLSLWKKLAIIAAVGLVVITAYKIIAPPAPVRSIAVLPFENLSYVAEEDYLVSGFKEELVQTLHGIDDFTVRTVRKSYDMEPCEIAGMLEVESVLLGSWQRIGDDLKINYTISSCAKGVVHGGKIEGPVGLLFDLQEELAVMVRNNLIGKSSQVLIKSRPSNSRAYDSYMRGVFELERRGDEENLEEAIELFEAAILQDKHYGPSYLALATAYALSVDYRDAPLEEMLRLALQTVEQGIELDPIIEDAAGAIYGYAYHKEKRWSESEQAYLRAVNADVVDSNAFNWYSRMLASVGRLDDALEIAQQGVRIDPSSGVLNSRLAIAYTWIGDSANAHDYYPRSNDLDWMSAKHLIGYSLLLTREGRVDEARDVALDGNRLFGVTSAWVEPFFAARSDPSRVPEALQALDVAAFDGEMGRYTYIEIVARAFLGDVDGAMNLASLLEQPGEIFEMDILFIPELRALRQHPEFMPLLDRLGITEYWSSKDCVWDGDRVNCPKN
jgi:DNA-binding winged helix-turn-helix (wHTH) protein/tetratricopeptide (TPR) repeat protein